MIYDIPKRGKLIIVSPLRIESGVILDNVLKNTVSIPDYNERLNMLVGNKLITPVGFTFHQQNKRLMYLECVNAYLYGLPNCSLPAAIRCGEVALRETFTDLGYKELEIKGRKIKIDDTGFYDLIEAAEKFLQEHKKYYILHYFRDLRNQIHGNQLIKEQDALECIRHITEMLNLLFPIEHAYISVYCSYCQKDHFYRIEPEKYVLGAVLNLKCERKYNLQIKVNI